MIDPSSLSGIVALKVAESMPLHKKPGEYDTEFVKRIVAAYVNTELELLNLNPKGFTDIYDLNVDGTSVKAHGT